MSFKTKWKVIATSNYYKLMNPEERTAYRKEQKKRRYKELLTTLKLNRMPVNKPKMNKKKEKEGAAVA